MAKGERGLAGLELRAAILASLRRASAALPADLATVSSELAAVMLLLEPEETSCVQCLKGGASGANARGSLTCPTTPITVRSQTAEVLPRKVNVGKHDLIEQLRSAFPAERIDGAVAFAQWGHTYPDATDYKRAIDGKTWEQLDHQYIVRRHDAIGFLSTRELVQLLPVYLNSIVEDGVMSPALDSVLVELAKPAREPARGRFDALVAALSVPQRKLIAAVLEYIVEQDPDGSPGHAARAALDNVWRAEQ